MTRRPKLKVIDGGRGWPLKHRCRSARGGSRCDVCFGPVPRRVAPKPFDWLALFMVLGFGAVLAGLLTFFSIVGWVR